MNYNLAQPFYDSACRLPDRSAINANGDAWSYSDVLKQVGKVSGWLCSQRPIPRRVGILASRSLEACVGILATAWNGAIYVPVNLALPEAGLLEILNRSGIDALIADKEGSQLLTPALLAACPPAVLAYREYALSAPLGRITGYSDLAPSPTVDAPVHVESGTPGYILYTSGSTGSPKGVVVPVGAVAHLLRVLDTKYPLREDDRVAETAATSFDLSVYNMFATWRAGAALHILATKQMMVPSRYIREHQLTIWFSVPSVAVLMSRMKLLQPGVFLSLRQTFFCGEPLLGTIAAEWQKAAPFSTVVNMYGPTEATVMCTGEDFGPDCVMTRDIVAIGRPFPGMNAAIASPELNWMEDGASGELLLNGPQLALGYLDDPEKTQSKFININGDCWYRTGDLAYRDSNGIFHFLGRLDNQVKILGYRVELEEIEFHLRAVTRCESVAAIAWPVQDGSASGIVAFVSRFEGAPTHVREAMKQRLPFYMVPSAIYSLLQLPKNSNGKVDRKVLATLLASGQIHNDGAQPRLTVKPAALYQGDRHPAAPSGNETKLDN